jgi:hypothetical protein
MMTAMIPSGSDGVHRREMKDSRELLPAPYHQSIKKTLSTAVPRQRAEYDAC